MSFLVTTPGVVADSPPHVPLLTDTGGFLIEDIALLTRHFASAAGDRVCLVGEVAAAVIAIAYPEAAPPPTGSGIRR